MLRKKGFNCLVYAMFVHTWTKPFVSVSTGSHTNCSEGTFSCTFENRTSTPLEQTSSSFEAVTEINDLGYHESVVGGEVVPVVLEKWTKSRNYIDTFDDTDDNDWPWHDFSTWDDDDNMYQSYLNQESSIIAALIEGTSDRTLR